MHPASLLQVKQQVLKSHVGELAVATQRLLKNVDPEKTPLLLGRLNG
jgi:phosphotransferase system enzyme I (PtsI)